MKKMERVVITGATGFVGAHLVRRMRDLQVKIRVLVRKSADVTHLQHGNIELFYGDLEDTASLDGLCKDVDKVFHVAATQLFGLSEQQFLNINVEGTRKLLEEAIRSGVGRVILVSSGGIHRNDRGEPVSEASPLNDSNIYFKSKIEAENIARHRFRFNPECLTIVRPGAIYGPGDRRLLKLFRAIVRGHFIMIGTGATFCHPVYIDDLVDGLLLAASNSGRGEILLLSGPEALLLEQWILVIARVAGVKGPRLKIPAGPVCVAASICEAVSRLFGVSPILNHRRLRFFLDHRRYDLSKAHEVLGYEPRISLEEGASRSLEWYTAQGWL